MAEWEHLSRVCERHWSFTGRVECREEVNEESDQSQVRSVVSGDVEAEASSKKGPRHVREGEKQQGPATESIDGPDSRLGLMSAVVGDDDYSSLTQAKTKLTKPKPNEAISALRSLAPACLKTVEL